MTATTTTDPVESTAADLLELRLQRASAEGLHGIASLRTLLLLEREGGLPMNLVAARTGKSTAAQTSMADRLTKLGFIRREAGIQDRRIQRLVLTFEGLNAVRRILSAETAIPSA